MSIHVKLKKGANINLQGVPNRVLSDAPVSEFYALKPSDFHGVIPKLILREGAKVQAGSPIFFDKENDKIKWSAPVSGEIVEITRGERRVILDIKIKPDGEFSAVDYGVTDLDVISKEDLIDKLCSAGVWPLIQQRPFDVVANPNQSPKAIFVSAFDSSPLAPDYDFIMEHKADAFKAGIKALSKLTKSGKVNLNVPFSKSVEFNENEIFSYTDAAGVTHSVDFHKANNAPDYNQGKQSINAIINKYSKVSEIFTKAENAEVNVFEGKHPAGNVGVQIHHLNPINAGEVVWVVNAQDVAIIGEFILTGKFQPKRIIALTGSEVVAPKYFNIHLGAQLSTVLVDGLKEAEEKPRFISGNVLTGHKLHNNDFIGYKDNQITVIPEGDQFDLFGWAVPFQPEKFSLSRTLWSWITPSKKYRLNTNNNGEERPFVLTGQYEQLLPMDVYPVQLIKACLIGDIELLEGLGIYEVAPEDFALCEFACTSKLPLQDILRGALDMVKKECA